MSTAHFRFFRSLGVLLPFLLVSEANAEALGPYKDELFAGQSVLRSEDDGRFEVRDYDEMRDINGRDSIPERRVKDRYVSLGVRRAQENETLNLPSGPLEVARVGKSEAAAFTTIFIHGRGGDRRLGINDFSFGGNFNRLKNLHTENGGTYYAPSIASFDQRGVVQAVELIAYAHARSGGRPVVLACASMGSFICWGVAREASAVQQLEGMVILGGAPDPTYTKSVAARAKLPIWLTHGSRDSVYAAADMERFYRTLRANGQPVRLTVFETGSHGTPIRMTDWRSILNWILS